MPSTQDNKSLRWVNYFQKNDLLLVPAERRRRLRSGIKPTKPMRKQWIVNSQDTVAKRLKRDSTTATSLMSRDAEFLRAVADETGPFHEASKSSEWHAYSMFRLRGLIPSFKPPKFGMHVKLLSSRHEIADVPYDLPVFSHVDRHKLRHNYRSAVDFIDAYCPSRRQISVQDSSRSLKLAIACKKPVENMQARIVGVREGPPWNWLDAVCFDAGNSVPAYLNFPDGDLLSMITRDIKGGRFWNQRDPCKWSLVSEAGFVTLPHTDGACLDTYIIIVEGSVGFAWMHQLDDGRRDLWSEDTHGTSASSDWRYMILRPGDTIYFQGGTVHYVFRLSSDRGLGNWGFNGRTYATGGHVLRRSAIGGWAKLAYWQYIAEGKEQGVTNEESQGLIVEICKAILQYTDKVADGDQAAPWGGMNSVDQFRKYAKVSIELPR